jgi:flagellar protein FlaI
MKIMYFIYRDFVGLNRVEPLLNDQYIEDIECNGLNFPLYVVHRKYENIRTNVTFTGDELKDFVEKVAQKAGRYISYAKPILDGTLPDGSRVNATYTDDVTTRGPTFTIRKFTKEPWTPLYLVKMKTADTRLFAFLWLVIQHKFNVMLIGETASGKTTFLNAISQFIPPEARICSVEDTRELNLMHDNWLPAVTREGFGIPSIEGKATGSINLFDLLKETFRQNPDYVILGETRGPETSVLFQGMASGHPSLSTFHAASPEMLVKRLETPPINLPASLIESLDIICSITHVKTQDRNFRRVSGIAEVDTVKTGELGDLSYNSVFEWNATKDQLDHNQKSLVFEKIAKRTGLTHQQLDDELELRTRILDTMIEKNYLTFKEFSKLIHLFYKDEDELLTKLGMKR